MWGEEGLADSCSHLVSQSQGTGIEQQVHVVSCALAQPSPSGAPVLVCQHLQKGLSDRSHWVASRVWAEMRVVNVARVGHGGWVAAPGSFLLAKSRMGAGRI